MSSPLETTLNLAVSCVRDVQLALASQPLVYNPQTNTILVSALVSMRHAMFDLQPFHSNTSIAHMIDRMRYIYGSACSWMNTKKNRNLASPMYHHTMKLISKSLAVTLKPQVEFNTNGTVLDFMRTSTMKSISASFTQQPSTIDVGVVDVKPQPTHFDNVITEYHHHHHHHCNYEISSNKDTIDQEAVDATDTLLFELEELNECITKKIPIDHAIDSLHTAIAAVDRISVRFPRLMVIAARADVISADVVHAHESVSHTRSQRMYDMTNALNREKQSIEAILSAPLEPISVQSFRYVISALHDVTSLIRELAAPVTTTTHTNRPSVDDLVCIGTTCNALWRSIKVMTDVMPATPHQSATAFIQRLTYVLQDVHATLPFGVDEWLHHEHLIFDELVETQSHLSRCLEDELHATKSKKHIDQNKNVAVEATTHTEKNAVATAAVATATVAAVV